jgi:uncharacterized protein (TIGR02246 family)
MNHVSVSPGTTASDAERKVRQLLAGYFEAVEQHDLGTFLSFFQECEQFTVFEDKEMYGWKEFVAFAEGFFQAVATIAFEREACSVDVVAPNVAVATGVFRGIGKTTSGEAVSVRNVFTFVLSNGDEGWRIRHVHESTLI